MGTECQFCKMTNFSVAMVAQQSECTQCLVNCTLKRSHSGVLQEMRILHTYKESK
jgi:hypothetical protein